MKIADGNACSLMVDGMGLCNEPRKLPMPDAGGHTSSVKPWLLLCTDAKLDIYIDILSLSKLS